MESSYLDDMIIESSPPLVHDEERFKKFINQLKLNGGGIFEESQPSLEDHIQYFLFQGHISNVLMNARPNDVAKLPDLIANVYRGVYPSFISSLDVVVESILKSIALSMHNQSFENARLLSTLCLNFLPYWDPVERFVRDFNLSSTKKNHVIDSLNDLDCMRRRPIYKLYLRYCQSADEVEKLFGDFEHFDSDIHELLISKSSFDSKTTDILLCCFRGRSIDYLLMFLKLWSDPVIAKADVSTEILYYTRAIFISFFHIPNDVLKKRYLEISKLLAEGLPHHFSSSDGRTLKLAKFLSDFMIFTLKQCGVVGERNDTEGEGLPINPVDDLSRELLCSYQNCCSLSKNFWYSKYHGVDKNQCVEKEQKPIHTKVQSEDSSSDDDDDDDLDPIETLDAPIKCPVVYIRDFIENLPDFSKEIDQMSLILKRLPTIIDAQLRLEHSSICKEMLEVVFSWQNTFDEASLDEDHKKTLEAILIAAPDVTIPEICHYFHNRPNIIAPEKCLILNVLSRTISNPKLDLNILKYIADSFFHIILREDSRSISEQAAPVQVPMIILSSQILTRLPNVMSKDTYLRSFLTAINDLVTESDHGMKETIVFALHQISKAPIMSSNSLSPELRMTLGETRNILFKVLY